ncbi:cupin domain-containing protein [Agarivorans sp. B2Z047]|uniref:cupin domain-containing protein n=1 Tax=Agarivorans sp. B2Z047 TaxID=2652721 RepID=UPI00128B14ED|nr:cupin domain-containing protein [Agarivorans sp. B2Z047]MPW29336.1 cupin domain-containing protein [Agarivorans sp. B2Z047]UQN44922.1 cupin domain-containing protein [Agarivorans sp. B2Z047]
MDNLFAKLPRDKSQEHFSDLLQADGLRVERIVSYGQASPEQGWYDQEENEWVSVLEGSAVIEFDNGQRVVLGKGDYLNIPAHQKHRVAETAENVATIWLVIFYK